MFGTPLFRCLPFLCFPCVSPQPLAEVEAFCCKGSSRNRKFVILNSKFRIAKSAAACGGRASSVTNCGPSPPGGCGPPTSYEVDPLSVRFSDTSPPPGGGCALAGANSEFKIQDSKFKIQNSTLRLGQQLAKGCASGLANASSGPSRGDAAARSVLTDRPAASVSAQRPARSRTERPATRRSSPPPGGGCGLPMRRIEMSRSGLATIRRLRAADPCGIAFAGRPFHRNPASAMRQTPSSERASPPYRFSSEVSYR